MTGAVPVPGLAGTSRYSSRPLDRHQLRPNVTRYFWLPLTVLTVEVPPGILSAVLASATQSDPKQDDALAGRAGLRDGWPKRQAGPRGPGVGCGIPSTSPRATTRCPGGKPGKLDGCWQGGCPRGTAWSGYARPMGCHTSLSVLRDHLGREGSAAEVCVTLRAHHHRRWHP